jgi:hypothetical protein
VSDEYVDEMKSRYGEESNAFRIRVLGEFPLADDDTVIPMDLIQRAVQRDIEIDPKTPIVWGVDVARYGSDSSALCVRKGPMVTELQTWKGLDLMELTGRIKARYDDEKLENRPIEILVDSIGLGAGVVDRLRELGLPVRGINVSESPALKGTYQNLRAELWFKTREWLAERSCRLPKDERLIDELAMVKYKISSSGKFQIESKEDIRKRGQGSPDVAESLIMTMASTAVTAMTGYGAKSGWNKPLKRNLAMV